MAQPRSGLVFAFLALLMQVWLGAAAPVAPSLQLGSALCGTEHGRSMPGTDGSGHRPDCALCPACATLAHQAPLLPVPPALPARRSIVAVAAAPPVPRSIVQHRTFSAQPRAPPGLA